MREDRLGVAEFVLLYFGGGTCIALWRGLRRLARRTWSVLQMLGVLLIEWWWVLWERKRVTRPSRRPVHVTHTVAGDDRERPETVLPSE